jgi:DNA-binding CsgD family transcriptional regulator
MMADLDQRADRLTEAGAHLREALVLAARIGDGETMLDCMDYCGRLCAATQRWAEAVTLWTAYLALLGKDPGLAGDRQEDEQARQDRLREAAQILGYPRMRAAEERGASMTLATAAEFVIILTEAEPQTLRAPDALPGSPQLSARERELVTLVARGHTDGQIAGQLYISISTVRSHLDRIRDKTSCRRRADLTRLALQAGLV